MVDSAAQSESRRITAGIVAHVDAGKTTLSEAMLYAAGALRNLGRVDHGDAFLDPEALEKQRGVTIHAHVTRVLWNNLDMTLLDTPGHVDFAADTERVLRVLDYAILVISGTDGVQGHTETLWRLLARYRVPVFLFVNKMDAPGADCDAILAQIRARLSDAAIPLGRGIDGIDACAEQIALQDEDALDEYLSAGSLSADCVRNLIARRTIFPVCFGSALRLTGISDFLDSLAMWTTEPAHSARFGARVYRISHDEHHNRLTWLRVTGGTLKAKTTVEISGGVAGSAGEKNASVKNVNDIQLSGEANSEKIDQIRVYNGAKFSVAPQVSAGAICAVTGLDHTYPGQGLGCESDAMTPALQPVLTYRVLPAETDMSGPQDKATEKLFTSHSSDKTDDADPSLPASHPTFDDAALRTVIAALRELEDEEPLLNVSWVARLQELHVQIMGEMQLDVIRETLRDRFGIDVSFDHGGILYRETVTAPMEGVGHFEPLRHYAEAHILIEPGEAGSGIHIDTTVSEDVLDRNWQRLIMTHLAEKEHLGVLIGAPLTDVRLTLVAGRAHLKHTEGGDFRQATYRAVRQGLMELAARHACRILEPWYAFRLEIPAECIGRAMSDIQRMGGTCATATGVYDMDIDTNSGAVPSGSETAAGSFADVSVLVGEAPVSRMREYPTAVSAYTHGRGHIFCTFAGYRPCQDEASVMAQVAYDPVADLDNTPDSVFCAHGAGYPVSWRDVPDHKHVDWATPHHP